MSFLPKKPEGDTPEAFFMKALWDRVIGPAGKILSVPGQYDVSYTEQGILLNLKIRPGGKSDGTVKSDFAGVYAPGETYNALQWVVVQNGSYSGAFISTADNNAHAPSTGIDWVQFSALPQWF